MLVCFWNLVSPCRNPNFNEGVCISIYECNPLISLVSSGGASMRDVDRRFLKDSQCTSGFGRPPHVCCTLDTGYRRTGGSFFFQDPDPNPTRFSFPGASFGGSQPPPTNRRNLGRSIDLPYPPSCGGISIENKIYGGEDSDLNEFPWMALLEYKKSVNDLTNIIIFLDN